jgi:signal transduction histidine kinase
MRSIGRQRRPRPNGVQQSAEDRLGIVPLEADNFDVGTPGRVEAQTQPVAAPALAIAVVTGILIALELLRPVHGIDAGARAALETAIAVAAVITARLLIDIFDRSRQLRELLLILGVLALSLADFSYWAGPVVAGVRSPASGGAVRLGCELIGALALAAAALVPRTSMVEPLRGLARVGAVLGLGVIAAGTLLAEVIAVHPGTSPAEAAPAAGAAHSVAVGVQVLSAAILAVAGLAFVARSWRAERGTQLLAGASLLLAAAGVQFVTVPTVPADWVTPREGARLVAFALLLGGVCLRYAHVQRRDAYTAICSVRERIARDLHDGLAQDLACITTQAQRLDCHLGPEHPLMLATGNALAELRGMIADLTASAAPTSEAAVHMIARELGRRLDVEVNVRGEADAVDGGMELRPRDDLIRATREAIVNAALHGEARHVDVALSRRAGNLVVHVSDDARGVPEPRPAGVAARKLRARSVSRLSAEWSLRAKRRRPA